MPPDNAPARRTPSTYAFDIDTSKYRIKEGKHMARKASLRSVIYNEVMAPPTPPIVSATQQAAEPSPPIDASVFPMRFDRDGFMREVDRICGCITRIARHTS